MKMKRLVSAIAALAMSVSAFAGFATVASAETTTRTPVMTYVDYDNADTAMGYVTTARTGYHKNSGFAWGNTGWGENKTTYLKLDATGIEGTITAASLSIDISGSSDSKRTTGVGLAEIAYTDWDDTLTYNTSIANAMTTVVSTVAQQWTTTKSATTFETKTYDITNIVKNDADGIITLGLYETAAAGCYVQNPVLTIEASTATVVDYTVNYNYDGSAVKTETGSNAVGQVVTAELPFTVNGVKYYAADGATTSMTLAEGENVLNVDLRTANSYNISVKATGGITKDIATKAVVEGENVEYYFPRYLADGTTLYNTPAQNKGYYATATAVTADATVEIPYTAVEGTEVAFFAEAEDIAGTTASTSGNANIRCSMGTGAYIADNADTEEVDSVTVTTLQPGKYIITAGVWGNSGATYTITAGENTLTAATAGYHLEAVGEEITLTEATDVVIAAAGDANKVLDYILIKKTGDVEVDEPILSTDPPMVAVEDFGEYTEYLGNPAKAYTGTFTVDPTKNYPVSSVTWYVGEASATTVFDTIISSGTVVTGLVVVAEDLTTIPDVSAWCRLYYGE